MPATTKRRSGQKPFIEDVVEPAPIRSVSLIKAYPEVAELWHYKLNCGFGPEDFSYGSSVQAWFKCKAGRDHIFQVPIQTATRAAKNETWSKACGFCRGYRSSVTNNLAAKFPELVKEWMTRKNGLRPDQVSYGSSRLVWWKCSKRHEWQAKIQTRTGNGSTCKLCTVGAPTDLRDYPEELAEFDFKRNKNIDPFALPVGVKVHWICADDPSHKWKSGFYRTTKQKRCPDCTNKRASKDNNLRATHPVLAKQWHPTKNGSKRPSDYVSGSNAKVWWTCTKGPDHEWPAVIVDRVRDNSGCPFCSLRKTSITNVISTQAPHLVPEWHKSKNGERTPSQERIHSRTKIWWNCSKCAHQWIAEPYSRIALGTGCPQCAKMRFKKMMKNFK